ncbi:hypothetical protein E1B28_004706 [Marasmius oreades]|uniref:Peptidase S53 domain-containing protein n=1 Tax=Marasmius oreades TaxID=181124 RepID=A0A9P7UZ94_9AGAR|nr:uncharacterized protein E1B28_004706 [Marasmius oreades]KAG7097355.1 hypothetical protein E1B28_004706 [Marasmius oreades]
MWSSSIVRRVVLTLALYTLLPCWRAYPDVAAQASGKAMLVDGTSASSSCVGSLNIFSLYRTFVVFFFKKSISLNLEHDYPQASKGNYHVRELPAVAGIVALLNDARLKNSQPPLGFVNPLLYSKGGVGFNGIITGNNPGCGTPGFNMSADTRMDNDRY